MRCGDVAMSERPHRHRDSDDVDIGTVHPDVPDTERRFPH
jgi:hypothetical protein